MKRVKAREAKKKTACKVHIKVQACITLGGTDTLSIMPHAALPLHHLTRRCNIVRDARAQSYLCITLSGTETYSTMHACSMTFASRCMALTRSSVHTCSVGSIPDNNTQIVVPACDDNCAVQLKYHSMNKEEMNAIAEAQSKGDMDLLYKHPRLKSIAGQGVITIKLNSVDRLVHPSWWRGGHKHVYVRLSHCHTPFCYMQHSSEITGVLAGVSIIARCQNGGNPPCRSLTEQHDRAR